MSIDFLIIGQGLAGSLLAWELMQRGCKVMVIDNGQENASQIAAGLINPITGMRFVKSADIDDLLPAAKQRYEEIGRFFQQDFYIEKPMLRLLRSANDYQHASKRLQDPEYQAYLGQINQRPELSATASHGVLEQKQTGYLLTQSLLLCLKAFFISQQSYQCVDFAYEELRLSQPLRWQNLDCKQLIFCEGHQAIHNPWFSWLPFQLAKGEILTLAYPNASDSPMLNYGQWLIPINPETIRIGATFDRTNLNTQSTETGKAGLLQALNKLSPAYAKAQTIKHQANIRPCSLDKNPFIGQHPNQAQLYIFNGFGAKGSLQIPWYSQRFADYLLKQIPLPPTCNSQRYNDAYFPG